MSEQDLTNGLRELSRRLDVLEQRQWERERDEVVSRVERLEARLEQQEVRKGKH